MKSCDIEELLKKEEIMSSARKKFMEYGINLASSILLFCCYSFVE